MKKVEYRLENTGDFIIGNYDRAKAFSSFFPGIAGLYGMPLWAFYVNRGQCVCSFGTKDKNGAILEFLPANQAYNLTNVKGFRTFIKLKRPGEGWFFYEPFKDSAVTPGGISRNMIINPCKLGIEEINQSLGIKISVSYITIPNEAFAAMARKVSITNISKNRLSVELLDGLPHIVPYGVTEWHQKHMSRTVEAWMAVSNADNNAPFYGLKVKPQDNPELEFVQRGNFYIGCKIGKNNVRILKTIIDPDLVFGKGGDISYPRIFAENKRFIIPAVQKDKGKTPSAFVHSKTILKPRRSDEIVSLIGSAKDEKSVNTILKIVEKDSNYFYRKLSENKSIITRLENNIFTKSSSKEFDYYAGQTYLDNLLRGGFPVSVNTSKGPFVFYAYARKHGDLERDYNAFKLEPSYFSQGNGAYRDINQNRRNDAFFNPDVKSQNIATFMNAVQPDGFNPHLIEGIKILIKKRKSLDSAIRKHVKHAGDLKKTKQFLLRGFTLGAFTFFLENEGILPRKKMDGLLRAVLAISGKEDIIRPGEGYWIDHWTYNIDLFENYLACYPDKLRSLLIDNREFTFYDTYLKVMPRSEKYVSLHGKIRQYGSVVEDKNKKQLIERRSSMRHKVRAGFGLGAVYKTNLLAKLICIAANKMASLDPFGIGIEMEAGKPGWCDSLNGLPGVFGSSLCEAFELKRLIIFVKSSIDKLKLHSVRKIILPSEIADFLAGIVKLADRNLSSKSKKKDFIYWDSSNNIKERYREKVWQGFSGNEKSVTVKELVDIFDKFILKLDRGIKKGVSKKNQMTLSYYINEVRDYRFISKDGRKKLNRNGFPLVKALSFSHKPVSLFLEGPMHSMRLMGRRDALSLYRAVKGSKVFDRKLKMYKVNEPLKGMPLEIGRSTIFIPGWLENESVWLHMEYKYLLEVLKSGLYEQFFADLKKCLIAFQNPGRYGRSILENSSFIASSAYPDKDIHGNGFVARLTGSTTEFISMWLLMCLGKNPFKLDEKGSLYFEPKPIITAGLFTKKKSIAYFYYAGMDSKKIRFPKNIFAFCLLGKTLVVYHNRYRRNTFGNKAVRPKCIILRKHGRENLRFIGGKVPAPYAGKIRKGFYDKIDISLC